MLAMWPAILMACLVCRGTAYMLPVVLMRPKNVENIKITDDKVSGGRELHGSPPIVPMIEKEMEVQQVSGGEVVPTSPIDFITHEQSNMIISWITSAAMCTIDEVGKVENIKIPDDKVSGGRELHGSPPIVPMIEKEMEIQQVSGGEVVPTSPIDFVIHGQSNMIISWITSAAMCTMDEVGKEDGDDVIEASPRDSPIFTMSESTMNETILSILRIEAPGSPEDARFMAFLSGQNPRFPATTLAIPLPRSGEGLFEGSIEWPWAGDFDVEVVEISSTPVENSPVLVTVEDELDCDKSMTGHYACQALILFMAIEVVTFIVYYRKEFVSKDEDVEEFFVAATDLPPCLGKVGEVSIVIDLRVDTMAECREFIVNQ